jgi:hypothetical protein
MWDLVWDLMVGLEVGLGVKFHFALYKLMKFEKKVGTGAI